MKSKFANLAKFDLKFERNNNKAKYFFFRRGRNDGDKGADWLSVTEVDRVSNDV
nr:hypothetical protein [uncultured Campylobacter sp.]